MEKHTLENDTYYFLNSRVENFFFNLVCTPHLSDASHIDNINQEFKSQRLPFCWWIDEDQVPLEVIKYFQNADYVFFGKVGGMFLDLKNYKSTFPPLDSKIRIAPITNSNAFKEWASVLATSFDFTENTQNLYLKNLSRFLGQIDTFIPIGAYYEDILIATASLYIKDGVGGFYSEATLEPYKTENVCLALYHFRAQLLKDRGIQKAVIQSNPTAIPLAKKIGFQPVINYSIYYATPNA